MNDKDRDLIAQVLKSAGEAGEQGFGYLVHYTMVSGLSELLALLLALACLAYVFVRLLGWHIKPNSDDAEGVRHACRALALAMVVVATLILISNVGDALGKVFAPEGAAIQAVLSRSR